MSFILDALRKSEHERQRSAVPGLAQVPSATANPEVPRWVLPVIGVLVVTVLVLGGAWWQSTRGADVATATAATSTRTVELPQPMPQPMPQPSASLAPPAAALRVPLAEAAQASPSAPTHTTLEAAAAPADLVGTPDESVSPATSGPTLPSAAALAAEGVALPQLRLELLAYSERRGDRFVFINGRKYAEGERLPEGPVLEAIEPRGAVLTHAGRRFLLVPE